VPDDKLPNREFLVKILATLELEVLIELNKMILSKKFKINDDLPLYASREQAAQSNGTVEMSIK
jgi:hypothetical protein